MRPGSLWTTVSHVGVRTGAPGGEVVGPGQVVLVLYVEGLWVRTLLSDGRAAWIDGTWWGGTLPVLVPLLLFRRSDACRLSHVILSLKDEMACGAKHADPVVR